MIKCDIPVLVSSCPIILFFNPKCPTIFSDRIPWPDKKNKNCFIKTNQCCLMKTNHPHREIIWQKCLTGLCGDSCRLHNIHASMCCLFVRITVLCEWGRGGCKLTPGQSPLGCLNLTRRVQGCNGRGYGLTWRGWQQPAVVYRHGHSRVNSGTFMKGDGWGSFRFWSHNVCPCSGLSGLCSTKTVFWILHKDKSFNSTTLGLFLVGDLEEIWP